MAIFVAVTMLCATVVMAAVVNEEEKFFINGKGYTITPILIENKLEVHTDSYYVPLCDTFEALGYDVFYDFPFGNHLYRYEILSLPASHHL